MTALMSGWERTFQRHLPRVLQEFVNAVTSINRQFHTAVAESALQAGISLAVIATLAQQLDTYRISFQNLAAQISARIIEQQKQANREFAPIITLALKPAYDYCTNDSGMFSLEYELLATANESSSGHGSFQRMKQAMEQHVEGSKNLMFAQATTVVEHHLNELCVDAERQLKQGVEQVYISLSRDYSQVLKGSNSTVGTASPSQELSMKNKITDVLAGGETAFGELLEKLESEPKQEKGSGSIVNHFDLPGREQPQKGSVISDANVQQPGFMQLEHDQEVDELGTGEGIGNQEEEENLDDQAGGIGMNNEGKAPIFASSKWGQSWEDKQAFEDFQNDSINLSEPGEY